MADEDDAFDDIDAKLDLADRYDRIVESQLEALSNVDTNAWRAARLIGILIGVVLTGLSLVAQGENGGLEITWLVLLCFGVGIVLLLVSLFFAALSILNVEVGYGAGTQLADGLNENAVSAVDYPGLLSKNLAKNIETNREVLASKADRLRYTYNFLLLGLIAFSAGVWFLITDSTWREVTAALVVVVGSGVFLSDYIINKRYDD